MIFTITKSPDGSALLAQWMGLAPGDSGAVVDCPEYGDRSVQVTGIFGGATLRWEGSNDGSNFYPLTDAQGQALDFTVAGLKPVTELCLHSRPRVISGSAANLNVSVILRRSGPAQRVNPNQPMGAI